MIFRLSAPRGIFTRLAKPLGPLLPPRASFSVNAPSLRDIPTSHVDLEATFEAACASRVIPGAVLIAGDRLGKLNYRKAFGVCSVLGDLQNEPLSVDSVMYVASCTKLLTTLAALQCVERGLVTLDEDVRPIVTELQGLDILQGDGEGDIASKRKNTTPITLRQLLTHQSGFSYKNNEPLLQQWRKGLPEAERGSSTSLRGRFLHPLLFEPGSNWSYGPSVDWAGVVVERLTASNLEEYMKQNIWKPLGISDMTFFLSSRPDMQARVAHMTRRVVSDTGSEDEVLIHSPVQPVLDPDMEDCLGGGGIFTSPRELFNVVRAVLLASDPSASDTAPIPPTQLLRRSTVDSMFQPELGESGRAALQKVAQIPRLNRIMGDMPVSAIRDWGLGGLLLMDDLPSWRGKGTLTWGGNPNLTWWIDPKAGLCGLYAAQLMPLGDQKSVALTKLFEREMYARLVAASSD
ncbi:beta-lactamase/transpeptidase-like protein [Coniochaeta sp. 2T2.1]|nr:beta-lactamase/transpeptidase-like protein [Coniochaeta sp. 2T2.1]